MNAAAARQRASECERATLVATETGQKLKYIQLAELWAALANEAERLGPAATASEYRKLISLHREMVYMQPTSAN